MKTPIAGPFGRSQNRGRKPQCDSARSSILKISPAGFQTDTVVLVSSLMRILNLIILLCILTAAGLAQKPGQKIFETEKAFEKAVAEKGLRDGFIEFLSPVGVMFLPDAVNAHAAWKARPESKAVLTWNPIWIDVANNGAIAYSVGNSQMRANGKDDPNIIYGHYLSIWMKQADGEYKAELDAGINHDKPASEPTEWKFPASSTKEFDPASLSAADASIEFYEVAAEDGPSKAYRSFMADDVIVLREGKLPAFDKRSALLLLKDISRIEFSKRKLFTEAGDLGYVHGPYVITDKRGAETERGNFVQVWKLRNKKWQIVADVMIPLPPKTN